MFRKEEAAVTDWSLETVRMCAQRQEQILEQAAKLLCPGGRLVYSTCTFAPEENEQSVERFLAAHPEFTPVHMAAPWFTPGPNGSFRLWPHKLLGEGHFLAVLQKQEDALPQVPCAPQEPLPALWRQFAKQLDIHLPAGKAVQFGQSLYWAPEALPPLKGMKVLRCGLELGEIKKDRFEPAHALALWLKTCAQTHSLPADSPQLLAYLRGHTIPSSCKGWCLIQADGYSIGWGKGDTSVLKNHYPKGLRRV